MPAPTDIITAGQDGLAAAIRAAASRQDPEVATLVADLRHGICGIAFPGGDNVFAA